MRSFILTICFIVGFCGFVQAQSSSDSKKTQDPFKNDPYFNDPIKKFFGGSDEDKDENHSETNDHVFTDLNAEGLDFEGVFEAGPYNSNPLYAVYPHLPMIHFNRVNSLFLGYREERMQWYDDGDWLDIPNIRMHGLLGYSTGQKDWQYSLGLEKAIGERDYIIIGGEYHNATTTNDSWRVGLNETSLTSFAAGYDYLDYYNQRGWGAYLLARSRQYFEGGVAFADDQFSSIKRETGWALFGAGGRYRSNPPVDIQNRSPVDKVNLSSIYISASFNPKQLLLTRHFSVSFNGISEYADPSFGSSEFDYTKFTGELISYLNFEPGGVIKHRLRLSGINGNAPRFKQLYLGGIGSLRALPYKSLGGGNEMILNNFEIHFGEPDFESKEWIDFDDFYLSLFLDSGWVNYNPKLVDANSPIGGFSDFAISELKHNGGIGVGSSLIRAELAWDLNRTSRAPVFWIRFNPTF
ncbi:hypothetical protein [Fodinibius halophilus]|uniref:BamA/TamA family outer membrane protein n=1 Tax=Fodinibius halophilus TaxID=1736908 RepID=A0A6M1TA86_9BACT|nr:hypothetical protein [Fodinibius halophilus]NGP87884.1 hypothetical protein [Fodinibius halophilus]